MKRFATLATTLSMAAMPSCGNDNGSKADSTDGISGIYSVTSQTKNSETCDAEGSADANAPAYYRIFPNSEIFPGVSGWSSESCSSLESCKDDTLDIGPFVFEARAGDVWTGESTATATGGINCAVTVNASTATKQADGTFVIEVKEQTGTFDFTGDDCDPDSAKVQEKRSELKCTESTKVVTSIAQ